MEGYKTMLIYNKKLQRHDVRVAGVVRESFKESVFDQITDTDAKLENTIAARINNAVVRHGFRIFIHIDDRELKQYSLLICDASVVPRPKWWEMPKE
jgi:hypothetical protein